MPTEPGDVLNRRRLDRAASVFELAVFQKQRWLQKVLKKLGTPEALIVLRQLAEWKQEQWPRS
jgi:hypothetical protein